MKTLVSSALILEQLLFIQAFWTSLGLLAIVAFADNNVKCRDETWHKVEERSDETDLCFKTFFLPAPVNFDEAMQHCEKMHAFGAPLIYNKDAAAIKKSIDQALRDSDLLTRVRARPVEIFLGGRKNPNGPNVFYEWKYGNVTNKTVSFHDPRWAPNQYEKREPDITKGGYIQDCLAFHYNHKARYQPLELQDAYCDCNENEMPKCESELQRIGVTCATRPALKLQRKWSQIECEDERYCKTILDILLEWYKLVASQPSLELRNYTKTVYSPDAKYTFVITENGNVTYSQIDKAMSVLFLDRIQHELHNNMEPTKVTPMIVTQNATDNYFDAVWDFNGGPNFSAQLLTKFNDNVEIVSQTFNLRKGPLPDVSTTTTATTTV